MPQKWVYSLVIMIQTAKNGGGFKVAICVLLFLPFNIKWFKDCVARESMEILILWCMFGRVYGSHL